MSLDAWIGDTPLTPEQRERFATVVADIDRRYPDPDDSHLREACMSVALQFILGETTADEVRTALATARLAESRAYAQAHQYALMSVEYGGRKKSAAARDVGIDRTVMWPTVMWPSY